MKPPGTNAGSGSISRLGPQFADRPPRIPRPSLSNVSNVRNSNRESLRLETVVTQTKQRIGTSSNRETEACFSTSNARQVAIRADRSAQNPHHLRIKTARKTNPRPPTFVSGRKKSALYFVQLTRILSEPMFRVERMTKRRKNKGRAEFARGDANRRRGGRANSACRESERRALPYNGKTATSTAEPKILDGKQRKKRFRDPQFLFRLVKFLSFVLFDLRRVLIEPMFRLERMANRRKSEGRAEFARGGAAHQELQVSLQQGHIPICDVVISGDYLYLAIFHHAGNYGRRFPQQRRLNLGVGLDRSIEIVAGLIYGRLNMRKERADLAGHFLAVDRRLHRAATAVAHYQNHLGAQDCRAIFNTADNFRGENVAGDAVHKNVADA